MGIHILTNHSIAVMYCSTTDWAFGPVVYCDDVHSPEERIEAFTDWLKVDARSLDEKELEQKYNEWLMQEKEQFKRIEAATEEDI